MPKGSYQNVKSARKNAKLIINKTGCDGVKLESNKNNYKIIKELVKLKIPVMGHIGYTPQFKINFKIEEKYEKGEETFERGFFDPSWCFFNCLRMFSTSSIKTNNKNLKNLP